MDHPVLLEMKGISKEFPGVKALDNVNLTVRAGTVHALMGENGAGKSTLMKCLFGIYNRDAGTITLDGKEIHFKSSKEALENGVAMVHQELNQALTRTVQDNLWLGRYPKMGGIMVSERIMAKRTHEIFGTLEVSVNPKAVMSTLPIPVVILIAMAIGAAVGVFNGFFVAKFKLHPFIVTLGTQLILYSCLLLYVKMGNNGGMAISGLDKSYNDFIKGSIISVPTGNGTSTPIPNYVWFAILLAAVMWFIWNKTTFGKNMFALGSNEEAARVSGVNVLMTTVLVFALAGAMYGWTGFVEGARVGSNTANTGLNYELDGIAACVIGGVSFVGGIGKIRGIVIGVLLLRLIFVGLNMASVNQDLIYLVKGGIILFACALDMRKYLVKK